MLMATFAIMYFMVVLCNLMWGLVVFLCFE